MATPADRWPGVPGERATDWVDIGGQPMVLAAVRDISDRKAWETELKVRNEELERFDRATVARKFDIIGMTETINALNRERAREPVDSLSLLNDKGGRQPS